MSSSRPKTYNQLELKSFQLILDRTPGLTYFCTSVSIPGVSANAARVSTPFTDIKVTGDTLVFQPLIVNMIVDEEMQNWDEIFDWMVSYTHPTTFDEYKDSSQSQHNLYSSKVSDGRVIIPNNKYNNRHEFQFVDLHPIDLSDVVFDTQIADTQVAIATVTFEYTSYHRIKH